MTSLKSWDEYAAEQRLASREELVSIKKTLQGILLVLILLLLVLGIPAMYLVAQL